MSLIEVLVAVAVLTLTVALGFPTVRQTSAAADWRDTQAGLLAAAETARAEAMRRDATVVLEVAGDGRGYGFDGAVRATEGDVRLSGRGIAFFAEGASSGDAVELSDGDRRATLRSDPVSGRLTIAPEGA